MWLGQRRVSFCLETAAGRLHSFRPRAISWQGRRSASQIGLDDPQGTRAGRTLCGCGRARRWTHIDAIPAHRRRQHGRKEVIAPRRRRHPTRAYEAATFMMSVARFGEPLVSESLDGVDLGDEVYVGLFVCAHNAGCRRARPNSTMFESSSRPRPDFVPYRDYIGSNLEILDLSRPGAAKHSIIKRRTRFKHRIGRQTASRSFTTAAAASFASIWKPSSRRRSTPAPPTPTTTTTCCRSMADKSESATIARSTVGNRSSIRCRSRAARRSK